MGCLGSLVGGTLQETSWLSLGLLVCILGEAYSLSFIYLVGKGPFYKKIKMDYARSTLGNLLQPLM